MRGREGRTAMSSPVDRGQRRHTVRSGGHMAIQLKIRAKRKPANRLQRLRCRAGNLRISFFEKPRTRKIRVIE